MNNRIKELLAQCTDQLVTKPWPLIDAEKFAELIVKECAKSLWTDECNNSDLALEEFKKNSKKIREHFGVDLG